MTDTPTPTETFRKQQRRSKRFYSHDSPDSDIWSPRNEDLDHRVVFPSPVPAASVPPESAGGSSAPLPGLPNPDTDPAYQKLVEEFKAQEHVVAMRERWEATKNEAIRSVLPPRAPAPPPVEESSARIAAALEKTAAALEKTGESVPVPATVESINEIESTNENVQHLAETTANTDAKQRERDNEKRVDAAWKKFVALTESKPDVDTWTRADWKPLHDVGLDPELKGRARTAEAERLRKRFKARRERRNRAQRKLEKTRGE